MRHSIKKEMASTSNEGRCTKITQLQNREVVTGDIGAGSYGSRSWNEYHLNALTRFNWRGRLIALGNFSEKYQGN